MINWKNLFTAASEEDPEDLKERRNEMLEKLFSANKGMSKLNPGSQVESIEEMMKNSDLMKMLNSDINTKPQIVSPESDEVFNYPRVSDLQKVIDEGSFTGVEELPTNDRKQVWIGSNRRSSTDTNDLKDSSESA
jgi:hypothetical protein